MTSGSSSQETAEGKMLVDAAAAARVRLYIYSSLPSFDKASNGNYKNVHHCASKPLRSSPGFV